MGKHVKSLISALVAVVIICSMATVVSAKVKANSGSVSTDSYSYTWEYNEDDNVLTIHPASWSLDISKSDLPDYMQSVFTNNTKVVVNMTDYTNDSMSIIAQDSPADTLIITSDEEYYINGLYFSNCINVTSVYIDEKVSINYVELNLVGITTLDTIKTANINNLYVGLCDNLINVKAPEKLERLSIEKCGYVNNVEVGKNLDYLMLYKLPALKSFIVPDNLERFQIYYSGITSINVPNSCKEYYVNNCDDLISANIEKGRDKITHMMFMGCKNLKDIEIPDGVTSIDDNAFKNCIGLNTVVLPDSITDIYASAFSNCNYLSDVYYGGTRARWEKITITNSTSNISIEEILNNASIHFADVLIETQPEDYTCPAGSTAEFSVVANGEGLKYQWQVLKNGTWTNCSINDGAKTATLSLEAKESRNGCIYHCIVTDKNGKSQTSKEATLTVGTPLAITTQPEDYFGFVGEYAVFNVSAQGEGLKYQWQVFKNGTWTNCSKNDGAKTATFTQELKESRNGNVYQCVITDKNGDTVTTDEVTLTVESSLSIIEQPTDFFGSVGNTAKFIVEAQGEGLKYQWQTRKNGSWTNCSINDGAKTNTLSLEIKESRNGCVYRCIVTDKTGVAVTSDKVMLIIISNDLYIVSEPESQFAVSGQNVTFTVEAEGDGVKYQWQYKKNGEWVNCSLNDGARINTLTQAASASRDGREYHCVITDKYGNVATTRSVYLYIISEDSLVPVSNSSTADSTVIAVEDSDAVSEETVDIEIVEIVDPVEETVDMVTTSTDKDI